MEIVLNKNNYTSDSVVLLKNISCPSNSNLEAICRKFKLEKSPPKGKATEFARMSLVTRYSRLTEIFHQFTVILKAEYF